MDEGKSTEELLRMLGREVQGVRAEAARTANMVTLLAVIAVANVALAAMWLFGVIEVTASSGTGLFGP